jgi:predicted porin
MQKKIIALAVAGLVSGAAFAQSTVTIDGIMDIGYQYNWGAAAGSTKSLGEVKSVVDGSRVGFHGVEDLGNGLKVGFDATAGFDIDTGKTYGQNGAIYSEGSSVYLAGNFGTVKGGYFSSSLDSDISGIDVSQRHAYLGADLLIGTGKLANHLAYISPDMSGFKVLAGYSSNVSNGNNQDAVPYLNYGNTATSTSVTPANVRAYDLGAIYKNGPIAIGAGYIGYRPQNNYDGTVTVVTGATATVLADVGNASEWQAGASYNFGPAAVSLYYAAQNQDQTSNFFGVAGMDNSKTWALGLAVPFTPADLLTVSYADKKVEYYGASDNKVHALGFFYAHNLSKRTELYALYGNVGGDNALKYAIDGAYENAVSVGIHHTF